MKGSNGTDSAKGVPSDKVQSVGLNSIDSASNERNDPPSNQPIFRQNHNPNSTETQNNSAAGTRRLRSKSEDEAYRQKMKDFNMVFGTFGKDNFGDLPPSKIFQFKGPSHLEDLEALDKKTRDRRSSKSADAGLEKVTVKTSNFTSLAELSQHIQKLKGPYMTSGEEETDLLPKLYYISEDGVPFFPNNTGFERKEEKVEECDGEVESRCDSSTPQMESKEESKVDEPKDDTEEPKG